jgi:class 3 adenylate cyclase/tetratricopeptide (TPR) repeat protein
VTVCASCGQENPEGFRLCGMCGAALVAPAPERRKLATLLFCDATGSTALGERLDAESVRELMFSYFHEMRNAVERHGGTVEKFVGDAVLAVFGVPVASEDDALRAVRAAAEMRERLEELNRDLESRFGARLALRMGINTGEVVVGDASTRQTFVSGDAVNTAARLEQAAAPGEILLGELTHRLAQAGLEAEPVAPVPAKGKAEPVAAFRLLSVARGPTAARRFEAPLVGRDDELAELERLFARAASEQRCLLATVVGEPGVGKSRLCAELISRLAGRASVYAGRCLSYGEGISYWPLGEIVRQAAGIRDEHSTTEARRRLAELVEPRVGEPIAAAIGLAGGSFERHEIAFAFRGLFEALAGEHPLVALVDDVHWAEPTLLEVLRQIAERARAPILLLCTARPELLEADPLWPLAVRLEPLGEAAARELVAALAEVPEALRRRVVAASGGNPLFVGELLALLREQPDEQALPPTLSALLAARLDRLPEPERAAAERAAIEGETFHRGAVIELSSAEARPLVAANLAALVSKELIRPAPASFVGEAAFRFKHALVREAVYAGMAKRLRCELHETFAGWLEGMVGDRLAEHEEISGYHLERSYLLWCELRPVDQHAAGLARRAADRLAAAGRRAFGRGDGRAAANLLSRADSLLGEEEPARLEILPVLAEALYDVGDVERMQSVLVEASASAERSDDPRLRGHVALVSLLLRVFVDPTIPLDEVDSEARRLIALFGDLGDDFGLARAWRLCSWVPFVEARGVACEEALEQAVDHARRAGAEREELHSLLYLAEQGLYGTIPIAAGIRRCEAILQRVGGSRLAEAAVVRNRATLEAALGRIEDARASIGSAQASFEDLGLKRELGWTLVFWGYFVELAAGDGLQAELHARSGYRTLEEVSEAQSRAAAYLARVLYERGAFDDVDSLTRISEQAAAPSDRVTQIVWRGTRAMLLARRGALEEAEALAREALALARRSDWLSLRAGAHMDLAEVLRHAGRSAEAADAADQARGLYERKQNLAGAAKARALLAGMPA